MLKVRSVLATAALAAGLLAALSGPAMAEREPNPFGPGQPAASGKLSGDDPHGVLHCQTVAQMFFDPTLTPGSVPGSVVLTPRGLVYAGPKDGYCALIYEAFTGEQP